MSLWRVSVGLGTRRGFNNAGMTEGVPNDYLLSLLSTGTGFWLPASLVN